MRTITNPNISEEFIEYLTANGFKVYKGSGILLKSNDCVVQITGNKLDVFLHHDEEEGERKEGLFLLSSFTGLDQLDIVKFGMLMHVCGAVSLEASKKLHDALNTPLIKTCVQIAEEVEEENS